MLEMKIKNTRIQLDFSFFAVLTLFFMLDNTSFGIAALAACGIHECSHILAMTLFGIPAEEITFYGAGIRISSPMADNASGVPRLIILAAGCAANFLAAFVYRFLGNDAAAAINLLTGLFNLLPLGEHDGAEMVKMLLIRICRPEKVDSAMKAVRIITALLAGGLLLFFGRGASFTLITTIIYILVVSFVQYKF